MKLFSFLFKRKIIKESDILNVGISFAMEFGANWLQPIQSRLAEKFPELNNAELDNYDKRCRDAMNFSNAFIYDYLSKLQVQNEKITSIELKKEFEKCMKDKYDWISIANLNGLFNQGMYIAWREGLA